jgi:hypothetical protein
MPFDAWKTVNKLRRGFRRQEVLLGAIYALLLAVATMAVTYLYY